MAWPPNHPVVDGPHGTTLLATANPLQPSLTGAGVPSSGLDMEALLPSDEGEHEHFNLGDN